MVAGRWFCTFMRGKIILSRLIFFTSTVERTGQAVHGGVQITGGYGALRSSTISCLGYGERSRVGLRCNPILLPLLPLSPAPHKTLATAMALHLVLPHGRCWIGSCGHGESSWGRLGSAMEEGRAGRAKQQPFGSGCLMGLGEKLVGRPRWPWRRGAKWQSSGHLAAASSSPSAGGGTETDEEGEIIWTRRRR
jgi:hypothetical protein